MMVFHHSNGLLLPVMVDSVSANMPNCLMPNLEPVRDRCWEVGTNRPLLSVTRRIGPPVRPSASRGRCALLRKTQHLKATATVTSKTVDPRTMMTIYTQRGRPVWSKRFVMKNDDMVKRRRAALDQTICAVRQTDENQRIDGCTRYF